jgi:hypothetical protein
MIWSRALLIWLLIIAAETLHGSARQLWLAPLVGDFRARQLAVFTGCLLIFTIAWLTIRWLGARRPGQLLGARQLLGVGLLWAVLTIGFEIGLGRALGLSWERIGSDYDLTHGGLMGFGLLFLAAAPWLAARVRRLI